MEIQKKIKTHNGKGFSIVEFLVVIFIIALLTTLVLVNYRQGQQKNVLNSATQRLAADLRRAQNSALAVKTESAGIPYGYGIYVDNSGNQYRYFYNTGSPPKYTGSSNDLEIITLPAGVTISPTQKDIFFIPPDPTTIINSPHYDTSQTFILTSGSYTKTVIIDVGGKIDIQ